MAVVFDLDGVLLDSEQLWDQARREVVDQHRGRWHEEATAAMQGMSSVEWSRYMRDDLGVDLDPGQISDLVVANLLERYELGLPLRPGAIDAVWRIGGRWPLGLASSANRAVIDRVLELSGLAGSFRAVVSSEEVLHGKPHPDVYLEAARRLGVPARTCAAVEDSAAGIRSAISAGLRVIAVPNPANPTPGAVLTEADLVIDTLADLTVEVVQVIGGTAGQVEEHLDEQEDQSFPASDPHSDWAGPSG